LYSFRKNSPATDRALGSIGSGGTHFAWGVRFKNNSNQPLQSVTVSYYLEQWRRSSSANEQPMRFSYLVADTAITQLTANENGYAKVPFLNGISPVNTPGSSSSLVGDNPPNRVFIRHNFRISVLPGQEIMLKWFDEDDSKIDHGLAIDALEVQFSVDDLSYDACSGNLSFEHFAKSIILDIPDEDAPVNYIVPTASQQSTWQTAMNQFQSGQYAAANTTLNTNGLDYRLSTFLSGTDTFYVVSKDGNGGNYWGTYVFNPAATRICLALQAPHPLHDGMTGEQAAYLFKELDAYALMIAGAHRCLSHDPSGCAGNSTVCLPNGNYTISDMAHTMESVFEVTTEVVATHDPGSRFIQLHGFSKDANDPYFVISNGTRQTPQEDFVVEVGDFLTNVPVNNISPAPPGPFTYEAPHLNHNYNQLIGTTNIQGRFLNNYNQGDICSGSAVSTSVTSRFLHIEQYADMRKVPANYPIMRDALLASGITDCTVDPRNAENAHTFGKQNETNLLQVRYSTNSESAVHAYIETTAPKVSLMVHNMMGQLVYDHSLEVPQSAEVRIETDKLPKGAYVLTASFGQEQKSVRFIIW
ncbi:MAG TPA: hypothetical protein DCF33_07295, partial [Saprospirales bacterium]|nr:hypothetical protein [Saprospirales bacterium]